MIEQATRASVPEASQTVVESTLRQALTYAAARQHKHGSWAGDQHLLLLRAAPQWRGPATVTIEHGDGQVVADVRGCDTVLAVLDAISEPRAAQMYLVVLTLCDGRELGNSVLARALGGEVRPIHRWDLVADAFGARKLDPRLTGRQFRWLAEALLDAQPASGWRRVTGSVLQFDTALQRLAAVRLGRGGEDERLDAAALLDWSRDEIRLARFLALRQEEQDGLGGWLEESVGPVAQIVFRLLQTGQVTDAIPFGLAAAEFCAKDGVGQAVAAARIRAEERFLGGQAPSEASLRMFGEAAESLTLRWSENGHAVDAQAMCDRAEQILRELGAGDLPGDSKILDAGVEARITALADQIALALPAPRPVDLAAAETALARLREHRRCSARAADVAAGVAAVRLGRWLAATDLAPATVSDGALRHVRCWAWVDRALAVIWNADTTRTPRVGAAYAALYRRGAVSAGPTLDRAFAQRLATWSPVAGPTDDLLLAENLLERIGPPASRTQGAADHRGGRDERSGRLRAGRGDHRQPDLDRRSAAAPTAARARSLSSRRPPPSPAPACCAGSCRSGSQPQERAGFAAFWRRAQGRVVPQGRPGRWRWRRAERGRARGHQRPRSSGRRRAQHDRRRAAGRQGRQRARPGG